MSHDAAETTDDIDPAGPSAGTDIRPQPPCFTARLDQTCGVIRARGHLDALAADLLSGSITALQVRGHRHITVLLRPLATVDADALELLTGLAGRLADEGVRLVVE